MASSVYYKTLADDMLARAKHAANSVEASRFKRSADEYLILAKAIAEEPDEIASDGTGCSASHFPQLRR